MTEGEFRLLHSGMADMAEAFASIAMALHSIAHTLEEDFHRRYPEKGTPRDATISYVPTPEEELREAQGQTGEATLVDWMSLGRREQAFLDEAARRAGGGEPRARAGADAEPLPGETGD